MASEPRRPRPSRCRRPSRLSHSAASPALCASTEDEDDNTKSKPHRPVPAVLHHPRRRAKVQPPSSSPYLQAASLRPATPLVRGVDQTSRSPRASFGITRVDPCGPRFEPEVAVNRIASRSPAAVASCIAGVLCIVAVAKEDERLDPLHR
ncbi:hypothetical protein VPH35_123441 [Triticum aestivum]